MGHEAAGVIAGLGERVGDWQIGERVTFDSTEFCGACEACALGDFNLCSNRRVLGVSCGDYRRHDGGISTGATRAVPKKKI